MENREQIKNRMVKTAARLWGYSEDETESAFDPLVNILFSACSLELEKVSNEVHASRARLLERMVQLLSPEVLCGPLPAHAIMHARSIEDITRLKTLDQFYWTQKNTSVYESNYTRYKDIFFSPTSSFQVNAASVTYLATGHQLFRYREMVSKEVVTHTISGKELSGSSLWLGITGPLVNLHNTQCYFDIRNEVKKELFYQNLPFARWYYGDSAITMVPGYNQEGLSGERLDIEQLLTQKNTALYKIREQVNSFYKSRFVTLKYPEVTAGAKSVEMPLELKQAFDKKDIQELQKENIRWIKVQFPENISNAVLQDVVCHFNCFPVVNTQLHELTHHMHDMVNIIPLYSSDTFFDLNEISDHDGKRYNIREVEKNVSDKLTVILRQGGIGRFDERDAATIIENIIQMLSDESAAFAVLGRDFLASEMKQLQQIIYKLEQQLQSRQLHRESTPFLVVRPLTNENINNLLITYWSTTGEQANDIKAGTPLMSYKTGGLYQGNCTLVSSTVGGRDRLSATESITAYKSALLSRDRLISMEDIKVFCQLQMGSLAKEIIVAKGVMVPRSVSEGFARTIDVTIKLDRKSYMEAQERNRLVFWKDNLVQQLTKKSAGLTPFRVFIEQV